MKYLLFLSQIIPIKPLGIGLVLSLVVLVGFVETTPAYESFATTISFYQGFTISSGMSEIDPTVITIIIGTAEEISAISAPEIEPLFEFSPQIDFYFGLTTNAEYPIEVVTEQIAGMVVLEDTAFEDVTDDLLSTLNFTERVVSIDSNDLVVLLLNEAEEEYALLGDVTKYSDATVSFTCWKNEIPEPSTLVLLGVGLVWLIGVMKRKHSNRSQKGGNCMKYFKTLLFALILVPLLVGTASAAEIRVMTIGTGSGMVIGKDIFCGTICQWSYPENTVIHLKAEPDPKSKFVGWLVNRNPHEGVITVEEDTLVQAIFELKVPLDEMTYLWYNGFTKWKTKWAPDEMAIFLKPIAWE